MKACIECHVTKPLSQFYKHPMMADGHLNKCIECVKEAVAARIEIKKQDPKWMKAERRRCRLKQAKYRQQGIAAKTSNERKHAWRKRHRQKARAHGKAATAQRKGLIQKPDACQKCETHGLKLVKHHPDYTKPLVVVWVCEPCHGKIHRKK